jgi:hypothetical protein
MDTDNRPWFKKKRYIILVIGVIGIFIWSNSNSSSTAVGTSNSLTQTPTENAASDIQIAPEIQTGVSNSNDSDLSNDNHYTNVDGDSVHSPANSSDGCVAAGATAECGDGTCSFSEHHSGTCSHHGGVSEWLN